MRAFVLVCVSLLRCIQKTSAFPARDVPFDTSQPDGSMIRIQGNGDERNSWLSDEYGYGIAQNENGIYVYVDESEEGGIVPTSETVGKEGPKEKQKKKGLHEKQTDCSKKLCGGTPKDPNMKMDRDTKGRNKGQIRGTRSPTMELQVGAEDSQETKTNEIGHGRRSTEETTAQTTGVLKNLVVLLQFQDHSQNKKRSEQIPTREEIEILVNSDEPDPILCPVGSLKSIYKEVSYGELVIESTVTEWVVTEQTEAWYADGDSG
jgi:hypothetical protein